jgi:Fe-S cluster assembly iron-binding protein IscA
MIAVTQSALTHISGMLTGEGPDRLLRITANKEGLALVADKAQPGDYVHKHEGKALLAVDGRVSAAIDGRTLDLVREEGEERLTLR